MFWENWNWSSAQQWSSTKYKVIVHTGYPASLEPLLSGRHREAGCIRFINCLTNLRWRPIPKNRSPDNIPHWKWAPEMARHQVQFRHMCIKCNSRVTDRIIVVCSVPVMGIKAVVAVVSQHKHITFRYKLQQQSTNMKCVRTQPPRYHMMNHHAYRNARMLGSMAKGIGTPWDSMWLSSIR